MHRVTKLKILIAVLAVSPSAFSYGQQDGSIRTRNPKMELRLAEPAMAAGLVEARIEKNNETVYLHPEAVITNADFVQVRVVPSYTEDLFDIEVVFSASGAIKMAKATRDHVGRPMAILIDGKVVSAPMLRDAIHDRAVISGSFSREEADALAVQLTTH